MPPPREDGETFPAEHSMQSLWLSAIQAQLALDVSAT